MRSRILIVDDDEGTRKSLTLVFGKKGYDVETAGTGHEGLVKAKQGAYDFALLDIKLPDMKGVELVGPLRQLHPDIVVMMATAFASLETAMQALNEGASGYVTKPLDLDEVLAIVEDKLEKQRLVVENRELYRKVRRELEERKRTEQEKRELEEQLERAQRMKDLGMLAGGVAHDLNNILGPMVAYPDLILMDLPQDSSVREDVLQIQRAAEKAAAVIQDLLTLARRGAYQMSPLSLSAVVEDYTRSPSFADLRAAHPNVAVRIDLAASTARVLGSSPHLSKVVMNLVINAFEAISTAAMAIRRGTASAAKQVSSAGEVGISVTRERLSRAVVGYESIEPGDYVVLRVCDTGVGIEEKDLDKLFQPFYTKKEMGRSGTGLGLTVVYGVVHDHRGVIDLKSQVDRGTEFSLYFPTTRESAPVADVAGDCRGEEIVLVVDDLAEQRELASRLLSSLGYQVRTAANGRKAVAYLEENDVDIVVLDMIMEDDFDGLETYRHISRLRPSQRVIIASGFSESDRVKKAQELGAGQFLRKPYTMQNIGRAIRQELDARPV